MRTQIKKSKDGSITSISIFDPDEVCQILLRWDYANGKPTPENVEKFFPTSRYIKTVKRSMMDANTLDNMTQTCVLVEQVMC